MKRVFLIHGWTGNPEEGWFPWLKSELESKGYKVEAPAMPNTDEPEINSWVSKISEVVGEPDEDTFFVGHSIGCQAIMRYIETLPEDTKLGGAVFVAGFFNLIMQDHDEADHDIARPWLETPIDTDRVKKICPKIIAIFSDNDPDVPLTDKDIFAQKLDSKIVVEKNKGHFSVDDGFTALSVALESVLELLS